MECHELLLNLHQTIYDISMPKILNVNRTSDYSGYLGVTDRHPLVTVIDYSEISPIRHSLKIAYGKYLRRTSVHVHQLFQRLDQKNDRRESGTAYKTPCYPSDQKRTGCGTVSVGSRLQARL